MLLAINVGNTHTAVGLAKASGWCQRWRLTTDARRTADEYGVLLGGLLQLAGLGPRAVTGVAICCVVPALGPVFETLAATMFHQRPLVIGPGVRTGLAVRYDPPAALGGDRVLAAVAARARFGAPVVAVDFGTATTFNVVDASGTFIGGAIAPGVSIAAEALMQAGARLRRIDLADVADLPLIGHNTEQSVRSGVLYGYAGLVEGLLARIAAELADRGPGAIPVVATGGMASALAPLVTGIRHVVPDLGLDGLRLVFALAGGGP